MLLTIPLADRLITIDAATGAREGGSAMPCHRCGVCCTRWQPLLSPADAAVLARYLKLDVAAFHERYTLPYPFDDEARLLRQEAGACVFLGWEADGRSTCGVHDARPVICREWSAGLDKRECLHGLERASRPDGRLDLPMLYPDPEERAAFVDALDNGVARG